MRYSRREPPIEGKGGSLRARPIEGSRPELLVNLHFINEQFVNGAHAGPAANATAHHGMPAIRAELPRLQARSRDGLQTRRLSGFGLRSARAAV
jgi:hypothetical protein